MVAFAVTYSAQNGPTLLRSFLTPLFGSGPAPHFPARRIKSAAAAPAAATAPAAMAASAAATAASAAAPSPARSPARLAAGSPALPSREAVYVLGDLEAKREALRFIREAPSKGTLPSPQIADVESL
jgi:hypothetical protein